MEDPERIARELAACSAANNATAPPGELYCEGTYDTWLCWPHTRANSVAVEPCPAFVPGFSPQLTAHKECTANGTWWLHPETGRPWSNYTTCVAAEEDFTDIITVYEIGYSVSLIALLLSLGLLFYFKNLRCARITVHMNLFASFALNNALWLLWYELVVQAPVTLHEAPTWCVVLHVLLQYAMLSTYTWMLCEGLYLHTVLVRAFVAEKRLLRALLAVGWLLPAVAAAAYATRRALGGGEAAHTPCWVDDEAAPRAELATLVAVAVLLNVCFLCNIVRVLCGKLRARGPGPGPARPAAALHALRATCLLAPLFGLQYLLLGHRPSRDARWWRLYEFASALLVSLQGLCVAALYCLCNGEVLAQLRRRWRALTFRPRANSATLTTVSFVRSGVTGPGEDKV